MKVFQLKQKYIKIFNFLKWCILFISFILSFFFFIIWIVNCYLYWLIEYIYSYSINNLLITDNIHLWFQWFTPLKEIWAINYEINMYYLEISDNIYHNLLSLVIYINNIIYNLYNTSLILKGLLINYLYNDFNKKYSYKNQLHFNYNYNIILNTINYEDYIKKQIKINYFNCYINTKNNNYIWLNGNTHWNIINFSNNYILTNTYNYNNISFIFYNKLFNNIDKIYLKDNTISNLFNYIYLHYRYIYISYGGILVLWWSILIFYYTEIFFNNTNNLRVPLSTIYLFDFIALAFGLSESYSGFNIYNVINQNKQIISNYFYNNYFYYYNYEKIFNKKTSLIYLKKPILNNIKMNYTLNSYFSLHYNKYFYLNFKYTKSWFNPIAKVNIYWENLIPTSNLYNYNNILIKSNLNSLKSLYNFYNWTKTNSSWRWIKIPPMFYKINTNLYNSYLLLYNDYSLIHKQNIIGLFFLNKNIEKNSLIQYNHLISEAINHNNLIEFINELFLKLFLLVIPLLNFHFKIELTSAERNIEELYFYTGLFVYLINLINNGQLDLVELQANNKNCWIYLLKFNELYRKVYSNCANKKLFNGLFLIKFRNNWQMNLQGLNINVTDADLMSYRPTLLNCNNFNNYFVRNVIIQVNKIVFNHSSIFFNPTLPLTIKDSIPYKYGFYLNNTTDLDYLILILDEFLKYNLKLYGNFTQYNIKLWSVNWLNYKNKINLFYTNSNKNIIYNLNKLYINTTLYHKSQQPYFNFYNYNDYQFILFDLITFKWKKNDSLPLFFLWNNKIIKHYFMNIKTNYSENYYYYNNINQQFLYYHLNKKYLPFINLYKWKWNLFEYLSKKNNYSTQFDNYIYTQFKLNGLNQQEYINVNNQLLKNNIKSIYNNIIINNIILGKKKFLWKWSQTSKLNDTIYKTSIINLTKDITSPEGVRNKRWIFFKLKKQGLIFPEWVNFIFELNFNNRSYFNIFNNLIKAKSIQNLYINNKYTYYTKIINLYRQDKSISQTNAFTTNFSNYFLIVFWNNLENNYYYYPFVNYNNLNFYNSNYQFIVINNAKNIFNMYLYYSYY